MTARHVVSLHIRVWNPGARHRAVLLHGLGSDGSTMWRLADHLASRGYEAVAPDLRGQGLSPPATSYSMEELAADVRALGDGWDLVVGHSLGGAVAAILLAQPGFAARALLLDPVMVLPEESKPGVQTALLGEVGGALTVASVRRTDPSWAEEDVFRLVRASERVSPHVVRRIIADTRPWDLVEHAGRWSVPVTILGADPELSRLFSDDDAQRIEDACDSVRVVTVAQAGHSIHRDAPETVLAALDHALGELPAH